MELQNTAKATVAPLAGAWIEMFVLSAFSVISPVAPLAGAWIEIFGNHKTDQLGTSLPSRERGLKYFKQCTKKCTDPVAPLAGAWIEILDHKTCF